MNIIMTQKTKRIIFTIILIILIGIVLCTSAYMFNINQQEVQTNEAIISCKIIIGILTILLCVFIYHNLYFMSIIKEE